MGKIKAPPPQETETGRSFGRLYAADPKDRDYILDRAALRSIPRTQAKRRARPWRIGKILDQGSTSECTVYAMMQFLQSAPLMSDISGYKTTEIYKEAQKIDEWPGENYDGTSERAVLKIMEKRGCIQEYLWVQDEDIAREYLMTRGPLLAGTDWFTGMEKADKQGFIYPTGQLRGGHEYFIRWYSAKRDAYQIVNSWGPKWGDGTGKAWIKAEDFRYLLFHLNGDLVSPIERKVRR